MLFSVTAMRMEVVRLLHQCWTKLPFYTVISWLFLSTKLIANYIFNILKYAAVRTLFHFLRPFKNHAQIYSLTSSLAGTTYICLCRSGRAYWHHLQNANPMANACRCPLSWFSFFFCHFPYFYNTRADCNNCLLAPQSSVIFGDACLLECGTDSKHPTQSYVATGRACYICARVTATAKNQFIKAELPTINIIY